MATWNFVFALLFLVLTPAVQPVGLASDSNEVKADDWTSAADTWWTASATTTSTDWDTWAAPTTTTSTAWDTWAAPSTATTTTPETWWTPTTTCYTSYYTPTSTWISVLTQNEVIVTVTSYIPCPVTSTVIYYTQTCQECTEQTSATESSQAVGAITVTSYTTYTPASESVVVESLTSTSNGVVVTITTTNTAAGADSTVSIYQVTNHAPAAVTRLGGNGLFLWLSSVCMGIFAALVAVL